MIGQLYHDNADQNGPEWQLAGEQMAQACANA
jgi:hypothetical protein